MAAILILLLEFAWREVMMMIDNDNDEDEELNKVGSEKRD
jgi:hypothetical protein